MRLVQLALNQTALNVVLGVALLCLAGGCGSRETAAAPDAGSEKVLTLTKANFQTEVLASPLPVLVDFWAAWCGPCKIVAPTVAELAVAYEGRAKIGKVDIDAQPDLARQYEISAIPALLIFHDGQVVEQFIGVRSKSELQAALDKVVAGSSPNPAAANP